MKLKREVYHKNATCFALHCLLLIRRQVERECTFQLVASSKFQQALSRCFILFIFSAKFRGILSSIVQRSEAIEPSAIVIAPKVRQPTELHFCRKNPFFAYLPCLFAKFSQHKNLLTMSIFSN